LVEKNATESLFSGTLQGSMSPACASDRDIAVQWQFRVAVPK
jgi:hypothetical protein